MKYTFKFICLLPFLLFGVSCQSEIDPPVTIDVVVVSPTIDNVTTTTPTSTHTPFPTASHTPTSTPPAWLVRLSATPTNTPRISPTSSPTRTPRPTSTPSVTPTITPTVDMSKFIDRWEIFEDERYDFTFEYPAIWNESAFSSCQIEKRGRILELGARSGILFYDADGLTLAEYVNELLKDKDWILEDQKDRVVGGRNAITVDYRFGGVNRFGTFTLVENEDEIIGFDFTGGVLCPFEVEAYEHILETLEFKRN